MKINNASKFLAAATVVLSSVVAQAHDALPRYQYQQDRGAVASMPSFKSASLNGEIVKVVPSATYTQADIQSFSPGSEHFSLVGHYQGQRACTVFLDNEKLANPTLTSTSNLFNLVDRQAYMYSIIAHEMSHCLGPTPDQMSSFTQQALTQYDFLKGYDTQAHDLSVAIREVYADLSAVLLGATKTGDWTILDQYLIPEKMQHFDPSKASLLAVTNLIQSIDPKKLVGLSFEQTMNLTNTLFKHNAMNEFGVISLDSPIATSIMQEWYATGLETKINVRLYAPKDQNSQVVQERIELHRQFSEAIIGKQTLKDRSAISKLYGLKAYSLETQNRLLVANGVQNDPQGATLMQLNLRRIEQLRFVMKNGDHLHYGSGASLDQSRDAAYRLANLGKNPQASLILERELPGVMNNALMPGSSTQYNQRLDHAQSNIRSRIGNVLGAPQLNHSEAGNIGVNYSEQPTRTKMEKIREFVPTLFNR